MTEEKLLGIKEVAEYLSVSKKTVYQWIEKEGLPAARIGRVFRISRGRLDAWVKSREEREKMTEEGITEYGVEIVEKAEQEKTLVLNFLARIGSAELTDIVFGTGIAEREVERALRALERAREVEIEYEEDGVRESGIRGATIY